MSLEGFPDTLLTEIQPSSLYEIAGIGLVVGCVHPTEENRGVKRQNVDLAESWLDEPSYMISNPSVPHPSSSKTYPTKLL